MTGPAINLESLVRRSVFPASSPSRADQIAAQIGELIAKLKPGDRLGTKAELQKQAGVSAGTINETLRILQSRGLIDVRRGPHGGLFVAERLPMAQLGQAVLHLDTNAATIAEAMDIRDALDPMLLEDAVHFSSAHQVGLMRQQLQRMADALSDDDGIEFLHANWKLHAIIADVSPRPILRALYVSLLDLIEGHTVAIASDSNERSLSGFHQDRYNVHMRLVDAIADRDSETAREVLREHNAGIARPAS